MKKIVFAFAFVLSLFVVSCRQEDDMLSSQDITNLKIINSKTNNGNNVSNTTTINSKIDETVKPPKL